MNQFIRFIVKYPFSPINDIFSIFDIINFIPLELY